MKLAPREIDVAKLIAIGHPQKEIASELGITLKTVGYYVEEFRKKTGIHTIAGTVHYMIVKGYIEAGCILGLLLLAGCKTPQVLSVPNAMPMVAKSAVAVVSRSPRPVILQFRYPSSLPTNGWELQGSSNLTDWFVYPTNKYYQTNVLVNGVLTADITVTNEYPRLFFRIRVY